MFIDFSKKKDEDGEESKSSKTGGYKYVTPECKKHIPKPEPVRMKILFCSKEMKGLTIPFYS